MAMLLILVTALLAALASLAVRRNARLLELVAALAAPVEFCSALYVAWQVYEGGGYGYSSFLAADPLGTVVLITVAVVGLASTFYSIGYLREEVRKGVVGFSRVRQYYILLHLFLGAMFFAVLTLSPIMMWIAIEATTLSTAFLISFYNKPSAMEAAWKYLIINSLGLLLGFFGTLLFLTPSTESGLDKLIDWQTLTSDAALMNPALAKVAFVFVLIGYGTKVGLAPMHTWLPDAHSKAPSPISALLSGSLLNVALLAVLKFRMACDAAAPADFSRNLLIFFGLLSIVIAAFIIIVQKNYKRLFAYSSIEHMGIMALGFGFGGIGTFGALLHMIYHSLAKSLLFFSAGNLLLKFGSTKIHKVKGVLPALPVTGVLLLTGFLAITGVPPFGIFITEFYILSAGIEEHITIVIAVLLFLLLVFAGFLRHIVDMVFGGMRRGSDNTGGHIGPGAEPGQSTDAAGELLVPGEANLLTVAPPLFLLMLFAVASFWLPHQLKSLLEAAAAMIGG